MPLIQQIQAAAEDASLSQPFTTSDLKAWIALAKVVKDDGSAYADASIDAILSNSDKINSPTTNRNVKLLRSGLRADGTKQYWFD